MGNAQAALVQEATEKAEPIAEKECVRCKTLLPVTDFHTRNRSRDRLQAWCKSCSAVASRASRASRARRGQWEATAKRYVIEELVDAVPIHMDGKEPTAALPSAQLLEIEAVPLGRNVSSSLFLSEELLGLAARAEKLERENATLWSRLAEIERSMTKIMALLDG